MMRRGEHQNRVRELKLDYRLSPSDDRLIKVQNRVDELSDQMSRLQQLQEEHHAKVAPLAQLIEGAERYLKNLRGGRRLSDVETVPPSLRKNETLASAIEDRRHKLRMLAADRLTVESATRHSSEVKKMARTLLDAAALAGDRTSPR